MRYDIRVRIAYEYGAATGGGRHHLRLLPSALIPGQIVRKVRLTTDPAPAELREFTDFFGNAVTEVALPGGHRRVVFDARADVERLRPDLRPDLSVPLHGLAAELASVRSLDPASPHHFIAPTTRIPRDAGIAAFARDVAGRSATVTDAVTALGLGLHAEMAFDPDATTVDTLPATAFDERRGVCQDFAQIMITGLRSLGIPAGYVSGFLRTVPPPGRARLEGADAMHAWVRAWAGRLHGWVEFDPTNAIPAGEDHITVAVGRDYGDVAPTSGVLRMTGGQTSRQAVDVIPKPRLAAR
jgi:transglutaminase-like putative cysteine protease